MGSNSYYIIRWERSDALHKAGDRLLCRKEPLSIGHTDECRARLVNETQYEDQLLCTIVPNAQNDGWRLLRLSPYTEVRVNGVPVAYVRQLADGDIISFGETRQELRFQVRDDEQLPDGLTTLVQPRRTPLWQQALLLVLPLLAVVSAFLYFYRQERRDELTADMVAEARQSVLQIRVDSVTLHMVDGTDTLRLGSYSYEAADGLAIVGTAFLTADSLLVTARHCLEPWLGDPEATAVADTARMSSLPTRWAFRVETFNQLHDGPQRLLLASHCSLWRCDSLTTFVGTVSSTDFTIPRHRDDIVELGDYDHAYYWRSIAPRRTRHDMTLDDIAWMPLPADADMGPCTIRRASNDELKQLLAVGKNLLFLGFPSSQDVGLEHDRNELRKPLDIGDDGFPESDLAHNGDIAHGFSGGPVLTRTDDGWCCVGVVSVTDFVNDKRKYSVPITEIERYYLTNEQTPHDNDRP